MLHGQRPVLQPEPFSLGQGKGAVLFPIFITYFFIVYEAYVCVCSCHSTCLEVREGGDRISPAPCWS